MIHDAHLAIGHGGRNRMIKETQTKYKNITAESIMLYLRLCVPCLKKSKVPMKGLVIKPMIFSEMNSRAQVDLIDMQSQPDGDLKWILVKENHLTKFVQLRLVTSKRAPEIAYQLLDIFSIFGAPSVLQSDNGREFVNSGITELSAMWDGLKIVHGKPRHSQSQGSVERVNRNIEDMLITWLQSNSTTHWGDGLRFIQVMKNRAYHEGIKCLSYKAMFGQPMKVGLKTSNLSDDAIDDIFAEKELEKIISGQDRVEKNDPTENPTVEENGSPDITDAEGSVLEFQEETCEENVPSTEMVTEIPFSPSICAQRKNKITEKTKIVKSNLQTQTFKMTRLAREKFQQGKVGDTVKVRVADVDRGRCDSRNILGVIMEVDITKDLYRVGTKDDILNS